MRVFIQSPDNAGRIDGTITAHLLSGFPDVSSSPHDCDVIVVPISTFADYKFNPKLHDIDGWDLSARKPWVLLDFTELEWCYFDEKNETHLFGKNTRDCRWLNPHWHPFCDFVRDHPPVMYFKRELLAKDVTASVKPIDWPCYLGEPPLQSESEFNARPIEVFFSWGFSHPSRPRLHAAIFHAMTTHNIGVIAEIDQFEGYFKGPCARTWASIFAPWHARKPIADLEWYQMRSKMSVSLPGCGRKCFRHAEAPVGTIMALQEDELAWSYPWVHGENAVRLCPGHEFEDLDAATKWPNLYQIYLKSQETIALYRTKPYVQNYLFPLIEAVL
jgi:hypothetical protein